MAKEINDNQFTELSDDDLKQVTGGVAKIRTDGGTAALYIGIVQCPEDEKDEYGKCPQK